MTPFDRMEWLRLPLPTIPGSAAVVDTFELLTPAVLRELFAAANHPFSIALIPSDRFAARLTGREPLLTWAERVSLVQNFPISAICEVDSMKEVQAAIRQLSPAITYSLFQLPGIRQARVRPSALTPDVIIERARRLPWKS